MLKIIKNFNEVVYSNSHSYRECQTMIRVFKTQDSLYGVYNVYNIVME